MISEQDKLISNVISLIHNKEYNLFNDYLILNKQSLLKEHIKETIFNHVLKTQNKELIDNFLNIFTISNLPEKHLNNFLNIVNDKEKIINSDFIYSKINSNDFLSTSITTDFIEKFILTNSYEELKKLVINFPNLFFNSSNNYKKIINQYLSYNSIILIDFLEFTSFNHLNNIETLMNILQKNLDSHFERKVDAYGNFHDFPKESHSKYVELFVNIFFDQQQKRKNTINHIENFIVKNNSKKHTNTNKFILASVEKKTYDILIPNKPNTTKKVIKI